MNADAVEKFGVERLDPDDAVAARLVILLGQQHAIEPGRDRLVVDRFHEIDRTIETRNACAASADVRLHDDRKFERFGRSRQRIDVGHHASLRRANSESRQKRDLQRLARLDSEGGRTVEDVDAVRLQPRQVVVRREDRSTPPAPPCGWAHAVEGRRNQRWLSGRIEGVIVGVHANMRCSAAIELREQRTEPIGVFVEDQKRSCCHSTSSAKNKKPATASRAGFRVIDALCC